MNNVGMAPEIEPLLQEMLRSSGRIIDILKSVIVRNKQSHTSAVWQRGGVIVASNNYNDTNGLALHLKHIPSPF